MKRIVGVAYASAVLGFGLCSIGSPAHATNYTDFYWGGNDVLGMETLANSGVHTFDISSMDVSISGNNLVVTINTKYAGHDGFDQTNYGALFINSTGPVTDGGGNAIRPDALTPYKTDTSTSLPGRFDYAAVLPTGLGTTNTNQSGVTGALYKLATDGLNTQISYWPNTSTGNNTNNSGGIFRNNQAVTIKNNPTNTGKEVDYTIDVDDSITFVLKDFVSLLTGTEFALAWAMTCANDVILVNVPVPPFSPPPGGTPLPGALSLFAGGLGLLGFLGHRRKRQVAKLAA